MESKKESELKHGLRLGSKKPRNSQFDCCIIM